MLRGPLGGAGTAPGSRLKRVSSGLLGSVGAGYAYDHDVEGGVSGQNYFPDAMTERPEFYTPTQNGREAAVKERLERFRTVRRVKQNR